MNAASVLVLLVVFSMQCYASADLVDDIEVTWSGDHIRRSADGTELFLQLDSSSGSGFRSKHKYLFGAFNMDIKLVPGESAGTVTSFYLQTESTTSTGPNYYEYDFEFLGNVSGEPYIAQTNVYAGGKGGREERLYLWFDPTVDFHTYSFVWSKQHTLFLVDSIPVRIFKNNEAKGIPYASEEAMNIHSSLWNGEDWATQGGLVKTKWSYAPFTAAFRNFTANACVWNDDSKCKNVMMDQKFEEIHDNEHSKLNWVRNNYMVYDYCADKARYPSPPLECLL